ncbi:MAG: 50S ribosomal protein L25 [Bdellovibrionales bacterium]
MSQNTIEVTNRNAMRAANVKGRKEGFVPAVVYGPKQESTPLFIPNKFFVFNGTNDDDNTIYTLKGDALEGTQVMIKTITKNPIGNKITHVDLYAPDMTKSVRVEVELDFQGEPEALKEGGLLQTIRRTIEIECSVSAIPTSIAVDISGLAMGDTLKMGDIKVDAKYTVMSAPEYAVISLTEPKAAEEEPAAEAAPTEEAAAAAPAEEAKS